MIILYIGRNESSNYTLLMHLFIVAEGTQRAGWTSFALLFYSIAVGSIDVDPRFFSWLEDFGQTMIAFPTLG
jgi:hypothetical protein